MANERNVARARYRHASRDVSQAKAQSIRNVMNPPKGSGDKRDFKTFLLGPDQPAYSEAGIGSALKGIIKMATRSKYPKRAPKGSSLEERIAYRDQRAKELKAYRDRDKAKAEAKKEKRLTKYRAKKDAARTRAAARVKKREKREEAKATSGKKQWRDYGEERRMQEAYYRRQRQVPITEAKENAAKRAAASKRPSAAERRAAEYKASADRIERMQAGYKYKGGSGTRGGFRRGY